MTALRRAENRAIIEESTVKPFERVMAEVYESIIKNRAILDCAPRSIVPAVARAAEWGLQIGETAYLIPRKLTPFDDGKPRLAAQHSWHGKIELLLRYKIARRVDAHCIYEHDHFTYTQGLKPSVDHHPQFVRAKRGALIGAYAWAQQGQSDYKVVVLDREWIEDVRTTWSEKWGTGSLDEIPWYPKKTALNLLSKELPIDPKWDRIFLDDDDVPEAISAAA